MFDYLDIDEELDVVTVNGWVVLEMDKMPKKNDMFETVIDGKLLKVRVTKADDRKAIEINLTVKDKNDKGNNNKENNRKGKDTWA